MKQQEFVLREKEREGESNCENILTRGGKESYGEESTETDNS